MERPRAGRPARRRRAGGRIDRRGGFPGGGVGFPGGGGGACGGACCPDSPLPGAPFGCGCGCERDCCGGASNDFEIGSVVYIKSSLTELPVIISNSICKNSINSFGAILVIAVNPFVLKILNNSVTHGVNSFL